MTYKHFVNTQLEIQVRLLTYTGGIMRCTSVHNILYENNIIVPPLSQSALKFALPEVVYIA